MISENTWVKSKQLGVRSLSLDIFSAQMEIDILRRQLVQNERTIEELENYVESLKETLALVTNQSYRDALADLAFDERKDNR